MKLRLQVALLSLLMLTFPLATLQYWRHSQQQLLSTQLGALQDRAISTLARLEQQPEILRPLLAPPDEGGIYFFSSPQRPALDGDCSDWPDSLPALAMRGSADFRAGWIGGDFMLCIELASTARLQRADQPALKAGSHQLMVQTGALRLMFLPTGETSASAFALNQAALEPVFSARSAWTQTSTGLSLEVQIPDFLVAADLGVELIGQGVQTLALAGFDESGNALRYGRRFDELQQVLDATGVDSLLISTNRFVLAQSRDWSASESESNPESADIFAWLLKMPGGQSLQPLWGTESQLSDLPSSPLGSDSAMQYDWYARGDQRLVVLRAPIKVGGLGLGDLLLAETLTTLDAQNLSAARQLMLYSSVAFAVSTLSFLAYALWLTLRIRRLGTATSQMLRQGRQDEALHMEVDAVPDELGELSHQVSDMLARISGYTQYLQSLAGKLSHEIRTPMAVIGSSLEHLTVVESQRERELYLQRAQQGLERLGSILSAMSEATGLETLLDDMELQNYAPDELLEEMAQVYADIYSQHRIECVIDPQTRGAKVCGSPDLFVQMLDKLLDNAVDFAQGPIFIRLRLVDADLQLEVENVGPLLDASMAGNLFDSLVSSRSHETGKSHLGFGLFIVRRIAEKHAGRVFAENLADGSGVVFKVVMPCVSG